MNNDVELSLTMKDVEEIEKKEEALTGWLVNHFSSFEAAAFVLTSIIDATERARAELEALNGK